MPAESAYLPLLVSEYDATQILGGISSRTISRLRKKGLPYVQIGSRVMYDPRDLEAWINQQKITVGSVAERSANSDPPLQINSPLVIPAKVTKGGKEICEHGILSTGVS